ncbi:MAG: NAD-dependent epimerase/dehydratase family protein [Chitinophagaceae bacterium]|nr:MAG: NAD-dependent epimerase/dehydratase family protein [Chitinophagaceae bacterium]
MSKKPEITIIGLGWLGTQIAQNLIARNYTVKGSCTSDEKANYLNNHGINASVLDFKNDILSSLQDLLVTDVLIFTIPPQNKKNGAPQLSTILNTILQHASFSKKIKWIVFMSSTSVYGNMQTEVDENTECKPETENAKEIYKAEKLLLNIETPASILRLAGLCGPERMPGRFMAGKTDLADPEKAINLIHSFDIIEILNQLLTKEIYQNTVFNICADEHPKRKDFYEFAARHQGFKAPEFKPDTFDFGKKVLNSKIKNTLDYTFHYPSPYDFFKT